MNIHGLLIVGDILIYIFWPIDDKKNNILLLMRLMNPNRKLEQTKKLSGQNAKGALDNHL